MSWFTPNSDTFAGLAELGMFFLVEHFVELLLINPVRSLDLVIQIGVPLGRWTPPTGPEVETGR
ncbi:MAG: hypothetical protein OEQ14_15445 [Gammaproteobacteria bacterium]|nr:hypothetical protein [Gammaproteobacteria bacterium]